MELVIHDDLPYKLKPAFGMRVRSRTGLGIGDPSPDAGSKGMDVLP